MSKASWSEEREKEKSEPKGCKLTPIFLLAPTPFLYSRILFNSRRTQVSANKELRRSQKGNRGKGGGL